MFILQLTVVSFHSSYQQYLCMSEDAEDDETEESSVVGTAVEAVLEAGGVLLEGIVDAF